MVEENNFMQKVEQTGLYLSFTLSLVNVWHVYVKKVIVHKGT